MVEKDRLMIPEERVVMGTDGRPCLGEGEGPFTLGGWRKEAEVMDMNTAGACGGGSGDGKK